MNKLMCPLVILTIAVVIGSATAGGPSLSDNVTVPDTTDTPDDNTTATLNDDPSVTPDARDRAQLLLYQSTITGLMNLCTGSPENCDDENDALSNATTVAAFCTEFPALTTCASTNCNNYNLVGSALDDVCDSGTSAVASLTLLLAALAVSLLGSQ